MCKIPDFDSYGAVNHTAAPIKMKFGMGLKQRAVRSPYQMLHISVQGSAIVEHKTRFWPL